ncbi:MULTISPECIES: ParB/RepB/Spo0J family partition protein [unclassified Mesorhizobium]|uniref:ParB/RepB/Spo0J family partition protein n=1 Tax=unclassified Mesorhizobium TaxID=325217 RepID=UPI00241563C4|nr:MULTISPECIES: ParB/RepB/Spo0J family partition protein [unclassified Mesorhizobium]MDG4890012.1 ParB/RepB/Spo0J family partition protein [Mesorhizobium sp. WSM4887]MDG4904154.1 ParB/RepB/Spo0J family partition protein [Mesorhizobium sp. WSM4962]MDG4909181.1 ParB/RepB/Spo0J family partition protein [Mesorhizobium sp. WSM4898]MDG4921805.1 ParB/RepB/Spo0J family partition protein [Mesorhizobium sp. WSM4989]
MAKAIQKIAMNGAENIPYDKLMLSQKNVRRIKDGVSIEQLAEDVGRRKLIQSLNVRPVLDGEGEETGTFEVPAGGRRYLALGILIKQKRLAKNEPIPCIVNRGQETSAEEDSLAENLRRADLHPLDQFRAFKTLGDQGLDPDEIGARFFVSPATVRQRLRLASVSPKLLDLYEKDEVRLEQIMAFSITDDHARQEQVWNRVSSSHMQEPYYIRRLLTETTVRADDRRAVYVGAEAYEAAGGVILRDLFEQDSGGWFQDAALLEQLVFDKLKVDAETIRTEGWKWVEAAISFPYGHSSGMRRIYAEAQELSAEELERHDALKAEYNKLDADYAAAEEADEAIEAKLDQLGAELDAIDDRPRSYDPAQKAIAGVFVTLAANGELQVEPGFVRSEDEPRAETGDIGEGEGEAQFDGERDGVVVNGKPVNDGSGDDGEDDSIKPLPDRLVFDLTAQRTLALRNALAGDVDIAFVAALHAFVLQVFYRFAQDTCLEISLKSGSFGQVDGLAETSWAKEITERHEAWDRDLPDEAERLWDFLLTLDEASRKALFAHCVSLTLNAVVEPWNRRSKALAHADVLGRSLQFDMVDAGWTPTVEFLGRLTKARILQAVREARGADSAQLIDHMKKDIMAREAARLLEGSNWLPEPLRLEVSEAAGDAGVGGVSDEAALDGDTAELPAFLAGDADPSSDEPATNDGVETDHLQAAE